MKKAFFIMLREVRDFLHDTGDLSFSLLLPVLTFALIYGAFSGNLQFNGTAYIVNGDAGGKYSAALLQRLEANKGLQVKQLTAAEADTKLANSAILMAAIIPADFSKKLDAGQPTEIIFKSRGNGGTEGQIIVSLVQGAASEIAKPVQIQNHVQAIMGANVDAAKIKATVQQVIDQEQGSPTVKVSEKLEGTAPDPVSQFLPGIMTMYVLFAVNLTAQALVEERRKGTLERLMTTGLKVRELFFGKFLAYVARGFIQTAVLLLLAEFVFRLFTPLTLLQSLGLALIFACACSAIGLTIGSISRTQGQATWISVFFTMLMVMLSGTFTPVEEGTLMGTLSNFSINTYANNAFRQVITQGSSLAEVRTDILVMFAIAAAAMFAAGLVFRAGQEGK